MSGLLSNIAETLEEFKDHLTATYFINELADADGVVSLLWSRKRKLLCVLVEPAYAEEIREFLQPTYEKEMRNHYPFMCRKF